MKSEIEKRLKTLECETENVSNRGVPNGKTHALKGIYHDFTYIYL